MSDRKVSTNTVPHKLTARNNPILAEVKRRYNARSYKHFCMLANDPRRGIDLALGWLMFFHPPEKRVDIRRSIMFSTLSNSELDAEIDKLSVDDPNFHAILSAIADVKYARRAADAGETLQHA